ncbi:C-type lectin domain family 2 member L [Chelonia mydas]|uniref:C-type lectin domain family 2 member L n=1 Tax=Chelonia mydas TaxID=8469 RepID=M7AFW7_CHEMY|nr:C-type lectin domain family 2 member L [Chelonia mydas]
MFVLIGNVYGMKENIGKMKKMHLHLGEDVEYALFSIHSDSYKGCLRKTESKAAKEPLKEKKKREKEQEIQEEEHLMEEKKKKKQEEKKKKEGAQKKAAEQKTKEPPISLPSEPCPEDWLYFKRKCYYLSEEEKDWDSSQSFCSLYEASLAVIENHQEMVRE